MLMCGIVFLIYYLLYFFLVKADFILLYILTPVMMPS